MSEKLIDLSVNQFIELVASDAPAPGGGSVAALAGAQAAALMAMVCRLTIGKKKYLAVQERVEKGLAELDELQGELTNLVDADTEAYKAFGRAMALPKETEVQKAARSQAMREAAKSATEVPDRTLGAAASTVELIHRLHPIANKNCLSDMGTAMRLAHAAVLGAAMNVLINLPGTGDEEFIRLHRERVRAARERAEKLVEDTTQAILAALES